MIDPKNLVRHELIGLHACVSRCDDKRCEGFCGIIADETKNMIMIESEGKRKRFRKENAWFDIRVPKGQSVRVCGNVLLGRPEERIKKKFTNKWKRI